MRQPLEELDLKSLLIVFWDQKFLIAGITFLFSIYSIITAINIPNEYKAVVTLSPSDNSSTTSNSPPSQLGGLAALTGIGGFGDGDANEQMIALEIIESWHFVENFIRDNNLEVQIAASKGWDVNTDQLIVDEGSYDVKEKKWLGKPPTSWELYELFRDRFSVIPRRDSALIDITFEYYSPIRAKELVDLIIIKINEDMRLRKINMVTKNIEYLKLQLMKTQTAEMKQIFYRMIENETKTMMLAEVNKDYVFTIVNKAMIPEIKSKPYRSLMVIQATFVGGLISFILVIFLHLYRRNEREA